MFERGNSYQHSATTQLNYEVHGRGAETLLFLPGFGDSLRVWDDVRQRLDDERYTAYFLELKGFGYSSKPTADDYTIRAQAHLILAFMDAMMIVDVVLIGHSYGGAVALMAAIESTEQYPTLIKKLVLIDIPARADKLPFFILGLRIPIASKLIWKLVPHRLKARVVMRTAIYDQALISAELIQKHAYFYGVENSFAGFRQSAQQIIPDNLDDLIQRFKALPLPTLIIWGEKDRIISIQQGYDLAGWLPNAQFEKIPLCGHAVHEEQPATLMTLIAGFLKSG